MNQIKIGAILSYISIMITIIIGLVYTPVMIRLLGQNEYGLYALIGSIAAYFSILDLGLGNAIVRYISRNRAISNKEFESKLIGTFLILYAIIGFITAGVGVLAYSNLEFIFGENLTLQEISKGKFMILILTVNFALSFPLSVFSSVLIAHEKFAVEKSVALLRIILSPIVSIPFLIMGYGSIMLVIVTTIVNLSCLIFNAFYAMRKLKIHIKFSFIDKKVLMEIFGYSFFVFLNIIVDQIFWKTDQFILGIVSGTTIVAVYAIAMHFITIYMKFSTAISNIFLPKLSIMVAEKVDNNELSNVLIKYGRIQFLLISFILSSFIIFGEYFITVWAGHDYKSAFNIVLIVMLPLTIPLIQNIGIAILQAKNQLAFRATLYFILAIFNVVITIPLANNYGGIGTAFATSGSLFIGHIIIMNIYYHKWVGLDIPRFWKNIIEITVPATIITIISYFVVNLIVIESITIWIISVLIFLGIYLIVIWLFAMNNYEKQLFTSSFMKILKRLKEEKN